MRALSIWNLFLLLACLSLYSQSAQFVFDPGIGTHLATGRWIVEQGHLPAYDRFTFGGAGKPWVADQWLPAVFFWCLYSAGSWPLLFAAMQAIYLAFLTFLLYPLIRKYTASRVLTVLTVLYAFKVGEIHFVLRPVFFSFLFFCSYLWVILEIDRDVRSGRTPDWKRSTGILVLLSALWANVHPSFPSGLLLIGIAAIAGTFYPRGKEALPGWMVLGFASFGATFLNGYGVQLHRSIVTTLQSAFVMNHYQEWQPPALFSVTGIFFIGALAIVTPCFLLSARFRERIGLFLPLAVAVFAYLGFGALRMVPYFGFLVCIPLCVAFEMIGAALARRLGAPLQEACKEIENREQRSLAPAVGSLFCIGLLLLLGCTGRLPGAKAPSARVYPYKALAFLESESQGKTLRVLNEMSWGGFLAFNSEHVVPYLDDRSSLFGDAFYARYFSLYNGDGSYQDFIVSEGVDYFLLTPAGALAKRLESEVSGAVLYKDSVAIVVDAGRARNSYAIGERDTILK